MEDALGTVSLLNFSPSSCVAADECRTPSWVSDQSCWKFLAGFEGGVFFWVDAVVGVSRGGVSGYQFGR